VELIMEVADDLGTMDVALLDDLLDRARAGDESAFAAVYREVQPRLLRYLQAQAHDLAEDVAADTWLDVARAMPGFVGDSTAFRSWIFAIARNRMVDAIRRNARRPLHLVDGTAELEALASAVGEVDDDTAARAEAYEATQRAIALIRTLPPDQAEVLLLRVLAELDPPEVALLVGKPVGHVRVLAHRGLRRLARLLEPATADDLDDPLGGLGKRPAAPSGGHRGDGA
jgi:RNA polymerase sigma-70 factor (ECF subfamily)